ncbi:uncharacterized protein N7500_009874 [Penicillium coprophilum]|uniref:uncharacterized protein n=1 Tax=Penicillium coprophilum TaxID=36646 RepID=UPI002387ED71|nr:uncharacterized protein N7500_009874 [Penicillium coprophilum]KAJ5154435.1 hypothetical protein N7500_009874 [Penicillium coprophilum]
MNTAEDHAERENYPGHAVQPEHKSDPEHKDYSECVPKEIGLVGTSCGAIHPVIGPLESHGGYAKCEYRPVMALPGPADMQFPIRKPSSCNKDLMNYIQIIKHHPVVDVTMRLSVRTFVVSHSFWAYIEKGIQLGLRPDFVIFCGLRKVNPRAITEPYLFEELWFTIKDPADLIDDIIILFWLQLRESIETKLVYEGKAWSSDGRWVVCEGETIDQAKARVDDKERQRLKEQAIKAYEANLQSHQQARTEGMQKTLQDARRLLG